MTIDYTLEENDLLTFQLFEASTSKRVRKSRRMNKIILSAGCVISGTFWFADRTTTDVILFCCVLITLLLFPLLEKALYVRHFRGFIREKCSGMTGKPTTLDIEAGHFLSREEGNEIRIAWTEVSRIDELPAQILIKLKSSQTLILPKQRITNIDALKATLLKVANDKGIAYTNHDNWKWK